TLQVDRDVALEAPYLRVATIGGETLVIEDFPCGCAGARVRLRGQAPGVEMLARSLDVLQHQPELPAGQRHAALGDLAVGPVAVEELGVEIEGVGAEELRVITQEIAVEHDLTLVRSLGESLARLLRGRRRTEVLDDPLEQRRVALAALGFREQL